MIIVSNLHKMHLTLGDDRRWIRACIALAPIASFPSTVEEGSTTQTPIRAPGDMIVVQSHAFVLEEMRKLHIHLTNKLTT